MSRSFKLEGVVIKRKNFSEADKLVTIFSKNKGKISIKAVGVRKIASRRSPHIELFNQCVFTLHQGENMAILTEIDALENFKDLKKDLKKVGVAYHFSELIDGLCAENQDNPGVYTLLIDTFKRLSKEEDLEKLSYDFEIELLTLLGFHKPQTTLEKINTQALIEEILERRLKTKQILPRLS